MSVFGMQHQGWEPSSILPQHEQVDQSSTGGETQRHGTNSQGKEPGVVVHVDRSARFLQLICMAKGCQDSSADKLL